MSSAQTLKAAAQDLLLRAGIYHRIKASVAYDLYWNLADPRLISDQVAEVKFFRDTLRGLQKGALVFDIGANRGHKTHVFLRLGARVIAVEPDPSNQEVLRQSFLRYRVTKKPVTIVGKAVSDRTGVETMWIDEPGSAKNTLNKKWVQTLQSDGSRFGQQLEFAERVEVETTTVDELILTHGRPFYIKIDVEGHEPSVLRGLHSQVPFVSFEVNLPEFREEAVECVQLLAALDGASQFNYTVTCQGEMSLPSWLRRDDFLEAFASCAESSLEIFCRTV